MQYFANVVNGVVWEVQTIPDDAVLADCFQAEFAAQLVPCTAAVEQGWTWNGKKFAAPVPPAPTPEQLLVYANDKQWGLVTSGYLATVNGGQHLFACDGTAAAFMSSKLQRLALPEPPTEFNWQLLTGDFITVQAADFQPLTVKLEAYVQATFDTCAAATAGVMAGTIATFADIDGLPWPPNHD